MTKPSRPWFRFYVEALSDRKLRRLEPAHRWLWVAVLGVARMSPSPGVLLVAADQPADDGDLADVAGMHVRDIRKAMPLFELAGMIERQDNAWRVTNWDRRQFESDDITERTRKHRSKERSRNVGGNAPETEAESETEPVDPSAAATPSLDLLGAAATIIGERASRRPGIQSAGAVRAGVARRVVRDRRQDAGAWLQAHPEGTAQQLADHLEPEHPSAFVLPPSSAPEAIADFDPPAPDRIDESVRRQALASVQALRTPPEPAA